MNTYLKRGLLATLFTAGLIVLGQQAASAADNDPASAASITPGETTSGHHGLAAGNQVKAIVTAPVKATGNAISVAGHATNNSAKADNGGNKTDTAPAATANSTSGNHGTASGNQAQAPVTAPVKATGNAISVAGHATNNSAKADNGGNKTDTAPAATANSTSGNHGTASGNQAQAPVTAPVTVGGNAVTVIGDSTNNNPSRDTSSSTGDPAQPGDTTTGQDGAGSGNQIDLPITAPVTVGGNAVTVIGDSTNNNPSRDTSSSTGDPAQPGDTTTGQDGAGSGNQIDLPITAPVTVGGNAVTVIGDSTNNSNDNGTTPPTGPTGPTVPTVPESPSGPAAPDHPANPGNNAAPSTGNDITVTSAIPSVLAPGTVTDAANQLGRRLITGATLPATGAGSQIVLFGALGLLLLLAGTSLVAAPWVRRTATQE